MCHQIGKKQKKYMGKSQQQARHVSATIEEKKCMPKNVICLNQVQKKKKKNIKTICLIENHLNLLIYFYLSIFLVFSSFGFCVICHQFISKVCKKKFILSID